MPLGAEGGDETLHDGLLTPLTARGKLLVVALPTEGLAIFLVETFRAKVFPTESAEEVFLVPRLAEGAKDTLCVCVCVCACVCVCVCVCVYVCVCGDRDN